MGDKSKIEWTDATWNILTGCSRVSEGCRNCYAERLAATRLAHLPAYEGLATMTPAGPRWTGEVRFNVDRLDLPLRWKRPRMVFVNSQSDLFHEGLADHLISAVFGVMALAHQHTFQVLTKRPERARQWFENIQTPDSFGVSNPLGKIVSAAVVASGMTIPPPNGEPLRWPLPNVWLGCSIEDQATADQRIPELLNCPAAVRWVSAEPLLGPADLSRYLSSLDWVVVGGESGPGARPMHPAWSRALRDQCVATDVPYFFKQHGEYLPKDEAIWILGDDHPVFRDCARSKLNRRAESGQVRMCEDVVMVRVGKLDAGRVLDGRTWDQMPEVPA